MTAARPAASLISHRIDPRGSQLFHRTAFDPSAAEPPVDSNLIAASSRTRDVSAIRSVAYRATVVLCHRESRPLSAYDHTRAGRPLTSSPMMPLKPGRV